MSASEPDSDCVRGEETARRAVGFGGLRGVSCIVRFRLEGAPFIWLGRDRLRGTTVLSLSAATRAGNTAGGGETEPIEGVGVELRLSSRRDLPHELLSAVPLSCLLTFLDQVEAADHTAS